MLNQSQLVFISGWLYVIGPYGHTTLLPCDPMTLFPLFPRGPIALLSCDPVAKLPYCPITLWLYCPVDPWLCNIVALLHVLPYCPYDPVALWTNMPMNLLTYELIYLLIYWPTDLYGSRDLWAYGPKYNWPKEAAVNVSFEGQQTKFCWFPFQNFRLFTKIVLEVIMG